MSIWYKKDCIWFKKNSDKYGDLSNMKGGFPIIVNGKHKFNTSEALYQALRFSGYPEIQKKIQEQKSPMSAKMVGKPYQKDYNMPNWEEKRLDAMWWSLRAKLLCNWETFHPVLVSTRDYYIVEKSNKDTFWGAFEYGTYFQGTNCLGIMLGELAKFDEPFELEELEGFSVFNEPVKL